MPKFSNVIPRIEYGRVLLERRRLQSQLEASQAELEQHRVAGLASTLGHERSLDALGSSQAQEMKPYEFLARNSVDKVVQMLTEALGSNLLWSEYGPSLATQQSSHR